ncbi:hypothetical protein T459_03056 [Capsicum annuum]|uniref:Uncharacterized protein n=1 Tax=Capsicum annuum TaxID=4072 RepID=A0A2G3ALR4_CAPAN|nr:hypothetical protein T459_03056 [Capsicum annuum]
MEEKAGDFRVPLISSFFCLCVLTGGVLLVLYIFVPNYSTPWFPAVGLLLISRRASRAPTMAKSGVARTDSRANSAISNNNNDDNQAGGHSHQNEGDASSSINSTKESEMPLAVSVAP